MIILFHIIQLLNKFYKSIVELKQQEKLITIDNCLLYQFYRQFHRGRT
jgi:hypothetical protein